MNILLTGASGFLGSRVLAQLSQANDIDLELLSRKIVPAWEKRTYKSEIGPFENYSDALKNKDVVIHCAGRAHITDTYETEQFGLVNHQGTMNLAIQAAENNVKTFIFISTIKVNGEFTTHNAFTVDDTHEPYDDYAKSKSKAEFSLLELGKTNSMQIIIIRPPLVYGAGVKANFKSLLKLVNKNVPLPLGSIDYNLRSMIYVENLVDLIVTCTNKTKIGNQVFLASDGNDLSTKQLVREISNSMQRNIILIPVPLALLKILAKILGKPEIITRLTSSLQIDMSSTELILDWEPPYSVSHGISETVNAYLAGNKND